MKATKFVRGQRAALGLAISSAVTVFSVSTPVAHGQGSTAGSPIGAYMKTGKFEIPFNLDNTGARPAEVQLFVSRDAGASWQLFARQPPGQRSFTFDSAGEGTFWFATRTVLANGSSPAASGSIAPQLRVTVDATNPVVEAGVEADGNGQLILDYAIQDNSPVEDGVRAEYQTDSGRTWIPVNATGHPNQQTEAGTLRGRLVWVPEGNWRHVFVRFFAKDRAGNETVLTRQVERPRLAQNPIQLASNRPGETQNLLAQKPDSPQPTASPGYAPALNQQIAGYGAQPGQPGTLPGNLPPVSSPQGMPQFELIPNPVPSAVDMPPSKAAVSSGSPLAYSPGRLPTSQETSLATDVNAANPTIGGTQPWPPSSALSTAHSVLSRPAENRLGDQNGVSLIPAEAMRPIDAESRVDALNRSSAASHQPGSSTQNGVPSGAPSNQSVRVPDTAAPTSLVGENLRPSRSRQFSLDYEVESVGARGVEDVELWGTRDQGKTWDRWGSDPDRVTPFDIETTGEGVYGFRIVVVGGNGLASPRPQVGEPPDVYILVDTNAPVVRLTSAQYGEGDYEGSLVIHYACSDANLARRPISLSFGETPQGPWTTIAAGLPNSGEYLWPADPQLPRNIFLRVESVDETGNVGTHTLDTAISVQGLAPKARIRGFSGTDAGGADRSAGLSTGRR